MTVLAIHGLGSEPARILDLLEGAVPPGVRVIAPDVRAHGASRLLGEPADFALASLAREVGDALAPHFDGSPVSIVGSSMGAAIALEIVRSGRFPIDRLAVVRPAFTHEPMPANLAVFPVIGAALEQGAHRAMRSLPRSGAWRAVAAQSRAHAALLEAQVTQPLAVERRIRLLEVPRDASFPAGTPTPRPAAVVLATPHDAIHPLHVAEQWAGELGCPLLVGPVLDEGEAQQLAWFRAQLGSFLLAIR